ncbi:hypothetical protein [Pantanalinema sp. GBBB05]|uniref:hypothetical protein n=1 Tax=Pantanalinema sp. GBBB05 TaxID=2604139 RepID=UPI001DE04078|nr:hypothetical protein [Pantanalinema sp. GBBB05]
MSKGFGKQPNFEIEKRQLVKVICRRDYFAMQSLIQKFKPRIGAERLANMLTQEVLPECDSESFEWFYRSTIGDEKYETMIDMAMNILTQDLATKGCELGKDISGMEVDGKHGIMLSDRAKKALLDSVSPRRRKHMKDLLKEGEKLHSSPDPVQAIEDMLGVPFFDNLLEVARKRLETLTPPQAVSYAMQICCGIEARHPELENFSKWFLANTVYQMPEDFQKAFWGLGEGQTEACPQYLRDLLTAAGGEQYTDESDGECWISRDGILLLDKLVLGENRYADIVVALDAQMGGDKWGES